MKTIDKNKLTRQFRSENPEPKATPEQVGRLAENLEYMRQMEGKTEEVKKKKTVVEPINIPVNLTIPHRPLDLSKHYYARPRKVINPNGLSRAFTQDKLREGKILKQVDRELANDRKRKNNLKATKEHIS
jgi:hypothetical protein